MLEIFTTSVVARARTEVRGKKLGPQRNLWVEETRFFPMRLLPPPWSHRTLNRTPPMSRFAENRDKTFLNNLSSRTQPGGKWMLGRVNLRPETDRGHFLAVVFFGFRKRI